MWVYQRHRDGGTWMYTVGYFDPNGKWHPDRDYGSRQHAANRVNWLNGGSKPTEKLAIATAALIEIANSDKPQGRDQTPKMPPDLRQIAAIALADMNKVGT